MRCPEQHPHCARGIGTPVAVAALLACLLGGCSLVGDDRPDISGPWELVGLNVSRAMYTIPPHQSFSFTFADGLVSVRERDSGQCSGPYTASVSGSFSAAAVCAAGADNDLLAYVDILNRADSHDVTGGELWVMTDDAGVFSPSLVLRRPHVP
jgi:hypothetical protein